MGIDPDVIVALAQLEQRLKGTTDTLAQSIAARGESMPAIKGQLADLDERELSPATIQRKLSSARSFFRWLLEEGRIDLAGGPVELAPPILKTRPLLKAEYACAVAADHPRVGARLDLDTFCAL